MLKISTVNLSADATQVGAAHSTEEPFEATLGDFSKLLETFRLLDAVANHEADPHIVVSTRVGKFIIRTGGGKLYLYDARDPAAPYTEFEPAELLARLESAPTNAPFAIPSSSVDNELKVAKRDHQPAPHKGIAITMLAIGLALNGYTLYSFFYIDSVDTKPAVVLLTDPVEISAQQRNIVGTFATGSAPGDRVIVIGADGTVRFSEIGTRKSVAENSDTYRLGRHDGRLCLTTPDSGVIDVVNLEAVVYYRDTYRRTK